MPYLVDADKRRLNPEIDALAAKIEVGGQLNYAVTRLAILFVRKFLPLSYTVLAEKGLGHLTAAWQEWYDKAMRPYEDGKARENGDVYDELFDAQGCNAEYMTEKKIMKCGRRPVVYYHPGHGHGEERFCDIHAVGAYD